MDNSDIFFRNRRKSKKELNLSRKKKYGRSSLRFYKYIKQFVLELKIKANHLPKWLSDCKKIRRDNP
jgi:hypothetical protein